jgi:hypothetical protein
LLPGPTGGDTDRGSLGSVPPAAAGLTVVAAPGTLVVIGAVVANGAAAKGVPGAITPGIVVAGAGNGAVAVNGAAVRGAAGGIGAVAKEDDGNAGAGNDVTGIGAVAIGALLIGVLISGADSGAVENAGAVMGAVVMGAGAGAAKPPPPKPPPKPPAKAWVTSNPDEARGEVTREGLADESSGVLGICWQAPRVKQQMPANREVINFIRNAPFYLAWRITRLLFNTKTAKKVAFLCGFNGFLTPLPIIWLAASPENHRKIGKAKVGVARAVTP